MLYTVTSLSGHDPARYKATTPNLASWDVSWYWLIVYLSLKPRGNNALPSKQNIQLFLQRLHVKGTLLDLPHRLVKLLVSALMLPVSFIQFYTESWPASWITSWLSPRTPSTSAPWLLSSGCLRRERRSGPPLESKGLQGWWLFHASDSCCLLDVWVLRAGVRSQNACRVRQTRWCPPGEWPQFAMIYIMKRWLREYGHWSLISVFPGFAPGPDGRHLRVVQKFLHQNRRSGRGEF